MSGRGRRSKHYASNNKETVSRYSREDADASNIEPLLPLLPSSRSRHSSSSQTSSSSSSHERRVVVESDDTMLSSNNICHWIQRATQKAKAYDNLKSVHGQLKADHNELEARHGQLVDDFHQERSERERLGSYVEQLEEENARHRQGFEELQKLQKIARDHGNQCVPLRNEWKTAQAKLKHNADELREKREERNKLREEIKKLNARKAALTSSNQNLEARERKMKTDLEKLSSEFKEEKKVKEQLELELGIKNEETIKLRESNQKLDETVHRLVQFVNDNIIQENDKMLLMLIATQKGTVSAMKNFMDKYNKDIGTEKNRAEGWGKLQIPHLKSTEESAARAIMPQQENNAVINSTSCDNGDASGTGTTEKCGAKGGDGDASGSVTETTPKRGAEDDGNSDQGADDNAPVKRSRMSLFTQNGDNGKRVVRGEEEQQTGITSEQQCELPAGAFISGDDGNTENGFHEYISSPSDSDFATTSATSSPSSEDETTRFIKKEPADVPDDSSSSTSANSIRNSYVNSGLRSWE